MIVEHPSRALFVLLCICTGCAKGPYVFSRFEHAPDAAPMNVVVEYGKPMKRLDRMAWVIGIPKRILPLNAKIDNHQISAETTAKLVTFLEENDLADIHVYVNHYDPRGQWQRMRENTSVGAGWRYSLGTVSWLGYTLLPSRVFGGDTYNPYTNSIYLNSDVPAIVLKEAAYAKDVHTRVYPGSYVAVTGLPVFSLRRSIHNANDVFGYAREHQDWEMERQAYHVLYPQLGSEATSLGAPLVTSVGWWAGPAVGFSGAAVGHVTGRAIAKRRDAEVNGSKSPDADGLEEPQTAGPQEP
ncbi:MAG TPA: hypothetical protein VHZ24_08050 [Pirellulales bacterium]|jgi:hypothetical protein|nr:hypothetical protein [Pirellulales bacterium]